MSQQEREDFLASLTPDVLRGLMEDLKGVSVPTGFAEGPDSPRAGIVEILESAARGGVTGIKEKREPFFSRRFVCCIAARVWSCCVVQTSGDPAWGHWCGLMFLHARLMLAHQYWGHHGGMILLWGAGVLLHHHRKQVFASRKRSPGELFRKLNALVVIQMHPDPKIRAALQGEKTQKRQMSDLGLDDTELSEHQKNLAQVLCGSSSAVVWWNRVVLVPGDIDQ